MSGRFHFSFDWKAMGVMAYLPFVIMAVLIVYSRFVSLFMLVPVMEFSIPAFAAWWSIFLFQDVLEEEGSETVFSYPIPRWKLGIGRAVFFLLLYLISICVTILLVDIWVPGVIFPSLILQFGAQSVFFSAFGFFMMVLIRNSGWSMVALVIYCCTEILMRGTLLPWINVFLFNERVLPIVQLRGTISFCMVLALLLFGAGQVMINRTQRFQ